MREHSYYVYAHVDPSNNAIRYIGKGKGKRAFCLKQRGPYHKNWISKLKEQGLEPIVQFLETNLTEADAFALERLYIEAYRQAGANLCNLTNGGEGASGYKHSSKTKQIIGAASKSRKFSSESRKKQSIVKLGKENPRYGKPAYNQKQVIDLNTGFIWASAKEAAEIYQLKYNNLKAQLNGFLKNKTTLRYVEE